MRMEKILRHATQTYPRHSEGSMILLPSGKLLFAWSRFEQRKEILNYMKDSADILDSDNSKASIMGLYSNNGGTSWSNEHVIVKNTDGMNVMSPAFSLLPDSSLGLIFSDRKSSTKAYRMFMKSFDDGKTWTDPVEINKNGYKTGCHDRFTVLKSGRLIVPLQCTDDWYNHYIHVRTAYSDDIGNTWEIGEPIILPKVSGFFESGAMEPGIVEINNGKLLMVIRTAMGTLFKAYSSDRGISWREIQSLCVISPISPAIIRRVSKSVLILVWNKNFDLENPMGGKRTPLVLGGSTDEGMTWPESKQLVLEDDKKYAYSYPSCLVTKENILLTYSVSSLADQFGMRSLKIRIFPKEDILNLLKIER